MSSRRVLQDLAHPVPPSSSSYDWSDPFPGEPIACSCHRAGSGHAALTQLLAIREGRGSQYCRWQLATLDGSLENELAEAACQIADSTMRWRCRGALHDYRLWRDAVSARVVLAGADRDMVLPFVHTLFGDRQRPNPEEHARGWVAEFIWFRIAAEMHVHPERVLRSLEGPSFHATEPGGDGLAIWQRTNDAVLTFCLWEIKNHVGISALSDTVSRAYQQLDTRATEYLAKFTAVQAVARVDPEVDEVYARLVDLWVDNSDRSGAGVAVATHAQLAPSRCFSTMHNHFPGRTGPGQLEGIVVAIADFVTFTRDVRERVWTAL